MFISKCDIIDIITEGHRFLLHLLFVNIAINLIDGKTDFINSNLIKTFIGTIISVLVYHLIIKKLIETKLKNIKKECIYDD